MQYASEFESNTETLRRRTPGAPLHPLDDLLAYLQEYSRDRPETLAVVCFAVGFVLGWKLKPW